MGLPVSFSLVAVAFLAVLHYDPQFRHDLLDGLAGFTGKGQWVHYLLAGVAVYSMYTKISRHLRLEKIKGGLGLRLRINKRLGWVVVEVVEGGAGHEGGVQVADIITAVDGVPVHTVENVRIIRGPVGSEVGMTIVRGIKEADADVEADREEQRARAAGGSAAGAKQGPVVEDLRPVDFGAPDCDFSGFETLGTHHMRPSFAHRDSLP